MKLFRNPELQKEIIVLGILSVLWMVGMGIWQGGRAFLGTGVLCLTFLGYFLFVSRKRYDNIAKMGEQIDQILHGAEVSVMENCIEGDMAVLSTQVKKMVWRLQEQQGLLQKEKSLLADSMADISHQMKTPLTSIHLILSFLQEEDLTLARRRELVRNLTVLTGRIDWMVYAMLRMAKLDAGIVALQEKKISMKTLIQKSYETLAVSMDVRGISFHSDVAEEACMTGDMAWMTEAVTNVIKNCMEHTPEGGVVSVRVKENPLYTVIYVEDTGAGIAAEDLPHIFERFYRGKNADDNSVGIGLALSKRIILSQNGTIKAYNKRKGRGAVFEIRCYKSAV